MDNKPGFTPWWLASNATYRERYGIKNPHNTAPKQAVQSKNENPMMQQNFKYSCNKQAERKPLKLTGDTKFDIWKERISNLFYWIFFMIIVSIVSLLINIPIFWISKRLHWERFAEETHLISFVISIFIVLYIGSEVIPDFVDSQKEKKKQKK